MVSSSLHALAVVLEAPRSLHISELTLSEPGPEDVVVDIDWSGISTGTERLLYNGDMPPFPGLGYPLVPGYESVGRIVAAGSLSKLRIGQSVFVPGARCFGEVRGLFGGAASRVVTPASRVTPIENAHAEESVLLALAATAQHVLATGPAPQLIVGHGVLGRLLARLCIANGHPPPTVWERNPQRCSGNHGYAVCDPDKDSRRDYSVICDVSGDSDLLDTLIARLAPGGEVVLAGFYHQPLHFLFAPAFMREARLRVAAEWKPADLVLVQDLRASGALSLEGLITHRVPAREAATAYATAFGDPTCLKMILDWRKVQ